MKNIQEEGQGGEWDERERGGGKEEDDDTGGVNYVILD